MLPITIDVLYVLTSSDPIAILYEAELLYVSTPYPINTLQFPVSNVLPILYPRATVPEVAYFVKVLAPMITFSLPDKSLPTL